MSSGTQATQVIAAPTASRPFNFRLGLGLPLGLMSLLLLVSPARLDFAIARWAYVPNRGFIGRHSWLLENILHDRAKQAVITFGLLAIAGLLLSWLLPGRRHWRRPLGYLVIAMSLSTGVVAPLKLLTKIHCPWSLTEFGGNELYVPLLAERPVTDKPGRCWPAGHASAGFSLLALFFVLRDRRPQAARIALAVALGLGLTFSVGRMLQGAHFLSHNLWTALLDWTICLGLYRLILYRRYAKTMGTE